jgi:outer membrane protein assembly factor BamA
MINRQLPPNSDFTVTDASLAKSAVGTGYSIIPLPAFQYNRNEGAWIGALTPMFRANDKGQVEDIIAPLYLHNRLIGETFEFNYYGYRDETRQYHAIVSHATRVEHLIDVGYKDTGYDDGRYIISLQANSGQTAFDRFYGFGTKVSEQKESNYAKGDTEVKVAGGVNFTEAFSVVGTERVRRVSVRNGVVTSVPQTLQAYPTAPGIDGADIWSQGVTLSYDTRDNQLTPLEGVYMTATGESDQNYKTNNRDQWWRANGEIRSYLPHADERAVFVSHALVDFLAADNKGLVPQGVPFYERPTLGGENSLRGFGDDRFISSYAILFNVEERVAILDRSIMGSVIEVSVAPFLDVGRVGSRINNQFFSIFQVNPGMGVRLLARPNIASRLDVGYGRDGANVYVGLDYPF